ncbi:MAG: hypothetical protein ABEJ28_12320 [Salinigranum sp.]
MALCLVVSLSVLTVGGAAAGTPAVADGDLPGTAGLFGLAAVPGHPPSFQVDQGERVTYAPTVFRDVGGQVATEDGQVTVRGTAAGADDVLVVLIDRRGRIASKILSVDDNDTFDEDVDLVTPGGTPLSEGLIAAAVFSPGRDGVVGDGSIAGFARADLAALDESTRRKARQQIGNRTVTRTQRQVLELFYEESINDSGSDDLALVDAFTYTDGRTSIETVVPRSAGNRTGIHPVRAGETMVVRGLTNRRPDDNTITVEAVDGPTPEAVDFGATDEWGTDGVWSVALDTGGVEPGTYVLESDDGDDTDRVEVRILPPDSGNATVVGGNGTALSRGDRS